MSDLSSDNIEKKVTPKKHFFLSMVIPLVFVFVAFTVKLVETLEGVSFVEYGIKPLTAEGLWGILFAPFIHADWNHFFANAVPLLVLGTALFYFYKDISLKVFILIYIFTGVWVWIGGRDAWHIGASGVIYGLGSFLFFSGVLRNYIPLMAISLVVVFLYGSMFWGVIPIQWDLPYSWESHLYGSISGLALAVIYRKEGPQKKIPSWMEEEDDDTSDENYWENVDD